jgi:MFS family permease
MSSPPPVPTSGASGGSDRILTRNFVYACAAGFLFTISFVMFFPTLPIFIKELGGSASFIGVLIGGASLVSLVIRPFTGTFVESVGRTRFLMFGALLMAMSSLSYEFADSPAALWPARIMAGVAMGFYFTAAMAYIGDIAPPGKRGRTVSFYGMFTTLGIATGPAIGSWILASGSFRGLNEHLRRWMPGTGSDVSDRYNFAVVFVLGCLFALGSAAFTRRLWEAHRPVERQSEGLRAMVRNSISRPAIFPSILHAGTIINVATLNVFLPVFNEQERLWSNIGLYYTVFALAIFASRLWGGPLLDRYPRAYTIMPGLGMMAVGTALLALVHEPWVIFFTGVMMGAGSGMAQPGLQAVTIDRAKGKNLGGASATFAIGMDLGLITDITALGAILDATNFEVFFLSAAIITLAVLAALAIETVRDPEARSSRAQL